jgi:hypothetical protein
VEFTVRRKERQESMLDINLCAECGVPEPFSMGHLWLNNGDIVQSLNQKARMGFIECENLDPLFRNIAGIIGLPIDPMIVNICARGTELYLKSLIPKEVREMVRGQILPDSNPFADLITSFCHVIGYGEYEFLDSRLEDDEDDYSRMHILHPFSVPEAAGSYAGALSAVLGGEHEIAYEEIRPGLFEFVSHWTKYPDVMKEKLRLNEYHRREGDIYLERCGTCGCPKAFRDYHWYLDKGAIVNGQNGRRMALLGYEMLDAVFKALEGELGDTFPRVVVEAQKKFAKTGFYSIEEISDVGTFRTQLALRGLGNLREVTMGRNGLRMRIDNASAHLMTIGMAQGLFEVDVDVESFADWELSEEGDLQVEVSPRRLKEFIHAGA